MAARDPGEPALSADGDTWIDTGTLLTAAERAVRASPASGPTARARLIPDDPVAAVVGILAAQLVGAVPVVAPAGPDDEAWRHLLVAAGEFAGGEPLLVVVTSGTTGRPRAVVRTAASWHLSLPGFDELLGPACPPGAVVWAPGSPTSTLTLFALWHALATGRPVIASGRWRGDQASRIGREAVAVQCVPTVLADLLDARESGGLLRLRRAVVAGAAVSAGLRARARSAGLGVAEYYGAAELSFVAADPDGTGLRAFPGTEVAVRHGLIMVRSPYVALGYLAADLPAGTNGPLIRSTDGWAGVGDRGVLGADGRLSVRGRGDTVTSVGGHVVDLDDVERALADAPGVAEIVCFAEPDERLGARVLAVVRPVPGAATRLVPVLRGLARARLPRPARPVRVVVRDDLPRTPGGKVARSRLFAEVTARPDPRRTLAT